MSQPAPSVSSLLGSVTIEISPRQKSAVAELSANFPAGTEVYVSYVGSQTPDETVNTAVALRKAGFEPVPHVSARRTKDLASLSGMIERLAGEAGVDRALVIAGDSGAPAGPFSSSLDIVRTGLFEKHGYKKVSFAGHPEQHPDVQTDVLLAALDEKLAWARGAGIEATITSQFTFEADPYITWLETLAARGVNVPVRLGVAGPADIATLTKFAVRCGVGPSIRALTKRRGFFGRLLGYEGPSELIAELHRDLKSRKTPPIIGIHVFAFGGIATAGALFSKKVQGAL